MSRLALLWIPQISSGSGVAFTADDPRRPHPLSRRSPIPSPQAVKCKRNWFDEFPDDVHARYETRRHTSLESRGVSTHMKHVVWSKGLAVLTASLLGWMEKRGSQLEENATPSESCLWCNLAGYGKKFLLPFATSMIRRRRVQLPRSPA
jgi:hypothetical protein